MIPIDAELAPNVIEFENKTIELSGNAKQQFIEWRNFLKKMYELENSRCSIVAMSDDYKTKILLEKSKQDKANLFIKYIISIGSILFLSLVFFAFKDHFLRYFSLNLNEKNSLKKRKKTVESNTLENNKNSSKNNINNENRYI